MELHGLHHRVQEVPLPLGVHEGDAVPGAVQVLDVSLGLGLLRVSNTSEKCGSKLPAGVHSRLGAINASLDVTELLRLGLNGFGLDCWRLLGGKGSLEVLEVAHDLLEFIPELLYQGESVPEIPHPLVSHGLDLAPEAGQLLVLRLPALRLEGLVTSPDLEPGDHGDDLVLPDLLHVAEDAGAGEDISVTQAELLLVKSGHVHDTSRGGLVFLGLGHSLSGDNVEPVLDLEVLSHNLPPERGLVLLVAG